MRGVDVPESEIELAREFFEVSQRRPVPEKFVTTGENYIRMLAWYGMLRRGAKGTGGWTNKTQAADPEAGDA